MINIKNTDDNEWFKWCLVRYLNPARITKADKDFAKRLDFKNIKFPVKTRDIRKIEKKNSIYISVFCYKNKVEYSNLSIKKCCEEEHIDLLLIGEGERKHCALLI